jgi:hypothetical protein
MRASASCSTRSRRATLSRWFWCAASLALAPAAGAATILERSVSIDVLSDGQVRERTRLTVRLDSDNDRQAWSHYAIGLDENRRLEEVQASVRKPDGSVVRLGRDAFDVVDAPGPDVLHGSQRLHTIRFPALPLGAVLSVEHAVKERPYFPSGWLPVGGAEATESLSLEVRGAGDLRWRVDGELPGLSIEPGPGRIKVSAQRLAPVRRPEASPGLAAHGAVLRYGWGPVTDWPGVAAWYEQLLQGLPRRSPAVRAKAMEAAASTADGAARVAGLLGFVRGTIRYVAVEVGIGGFRPAAPADVLGRGWGDCKDKALLLVDLLAAQGIAAFPALVRASGEDRIDRLFPSPDQFNHMIVAVPAAKLALGEDPPIAGGYLFVDPTQPAGGLTWLHPDLQDQEALVVAGTESRLVRLPVRPRGDRRQARVTLRLDARGNAEGELQVELQGGSGLAFAALASRERPEETQSRVRQELSRFLPAARLEELRWSAKPLGAELSARMRVADLAGGGAARSLALPASLLTPSPSLLENRTAPVVLSPAMASETWTLHLPSGWCAPRPQVRGVDNAVGVFRLAVEARGQVTTVERTVALRTAWVGPEGFVALHELALAEHQAARRRIRFDCER